MSPQVNRSESAFAMTHSNLKTFNRDPFNDIKGKV